MIERNCMLATRSLKYGIVIPLRSAAAAVSGMLCACVRARAYACVRDTPPPPAGIRSVFQFLKGGNPSLH